MEAIFHKICECGLGMLNHLSILISSSLQNANQSEPNFLQIVHTCIFFKYPYLRCKVFPEIVNFGCRGHSERSEPQN